MQLQAIVKKAFWNQMLMICDFKERRLSEAANAAGWIRRNRERCELVM